MDKKNNRTILSFIFGVVFITLIYPIIDELTNVLLSWIEYLKILPSKLVLKGNKELKELQDDDEKSETYAIGFQYNPSDYDEFDDYDEESW